MFHIFFFSSRRRHTRFDCDWSSDVALPIYLQNQKSLLQGQLKGHLGRIRKNASDARRGLDKEERELRAASAQQMIQIRQSRSAKLSAIDEDISSQRAKAAPSITELNGKLQTLQRENFQFHWKTARQEHERQKFQRVRFRKYLAKVALGGN